jgi:hypothetical protein
MNDKPSPPDTDLEERKLKLERTKAISTSIGIVLPSSALHGSFDPSAACRVAAHPGDDARLAGEWVALADDRGSSARGPRRWRGAVRRPPNREVRHIEAA